MLPRIHSLVLDEFLVAENAGRLLGRFVAMSFADIILPDRYFYADYNYKAYEVPFKKRQIYYSIGSRLAVREESKERKATEFN